MHCSPQQSLVAEWLGPSVTVRVRVRVRVRARAREWNFSLFFLSVVKYDKHLCLALLARCRCTLSSENYDVKVM